MAAERDGQRQDQAPVALAGLEIARCTDMESPPEQVESIAAGDDAADVAVDGSLHGIGGIELSEPAKVQPAGGGRLLEDTRISKVSDQAAEVPAGPQVACVKVHRTGDMLDRAVKRPAVAFPAMGVHCGGVDQEQASYGDRRTHDPDPVAARTGAIASQCESVRYA